MRGKQAKSDGIFLAKKRHSHILIKKTLCLDDPVGRLVRKENGGGEGVWDLPPCFRKKIWGEGGRPLPPPYPPLVFGHFHMQALLPHAQSRRRVLKVTCPIKKSPVTLWGLQRETPEN